MSMPITTDLRAAMDTMIFEYEGKKVTELLTIKPEQFGYLCDTIDSIHAHLERQYESVKAELDRTLGEKDSEDEL